MKHLIQESLSRLDLKITHNRDDAWSPDIDLIGFIGNRLLGSTNQLRILQIGANDGQANDWLRQFVMRHDSTAVLVEPLPEPFKALKALYSDSDRVCCVNAALAPEDGEASFFHAHFDTQCPPRFTRVASFNKKIIRKHAKAIRSAGGSIRSMRVPTASAKNLIAMLPEGSVDVIGIDTEGFDTIAINLLLDAGAQPVLIVYEHCHSSGRDDTACRKRLRSEGYLLARINRDTVAVKADAWDQIE